MKLNHINLVVRDVAAAIIFFENCFHFTCKEVKGDNIVAVLSGADEFVLVLMAGKPEDTIYPKAFHIGFMQKNETEVIALYDKIKNFGVVLEAAPRKIRDSFGFYFTYDQVMIEVGCYLTEN